MKTTIKNLILSAVLVVGGASCVDLDTALYDRETDLTYWEEDPEAAVKALNNCYTYLGNMDEQLYSEAMTDNAYTKQPNDFTQNIGNGSYSTADSYVKQVWDGRYTGIRMCNQLLENIDRVPDLDPELKKRNILIFCGKGGSAGFLRITIWDKKYMKMFMDELLDIDVE